MKLQLSCDMLSLQGALKLIEQTSASVDIIELGTPLVLSNGLKALSVIKKRFPEKTVLADLKIMDGGYDAAQMAFDNGADIVTVLGLASESTLGQVIQSARDHDKQVMIDMIEVEDLEGRLKLCASMHPDFICIHTAVDREETRLPLEDLHLVRSLTPQARLAVAGGINLANLDAVVQERPDVVIVGRQIANAPDPQAVAEQIKNKLAAK